MVWFATIGLRIGRTIDSDPGLRWSCHTGMESSLETNSLEATSWRKRKGKEKEKIPTPAWRDLGIVAGA